MHLANTGTADINSDPVLLSLGPYYTYCNPPSPAIHNWHTLHYFWSLFFVTLCDIFHKGGLLTFASSITIIQANFLQAVSPDFRWWSFCKTCGPLSLRTSLIAQLAKNPPANSGDPRDMGSIPESEGSPGERNGNPLQYFCLENPIDKGDWWATVHEVIESDTIEHIYMHIHCHWMS